MPAKRPMLASRGVSQAFLHAAPLTAFQYAKAKKLVPRLIRKPKKNAKSTASLLTVDNGVMTADAQPDSAQMDFDDFGPPPEPPALPLADVIAQITSDAASAAASGGLCTLL